MQTSSRTGLLLGLLLLVSLGVAATFLVPRWLRNDAVEEEEDEPTRANAGLQFNRDIRPILANHCFSCHGPDHKRAGLDLQRPESAFKPLKSGTPAIVPGNSAASRLLAKVTAEDEDERMPPRAKGRRLHASEIAKLREWIDAGAPWETHWAYQKPERTRPPRVKHGGWVRNDIDRFILTRLKRETMNPAPEAAPATLLRRVYLDLIGLPPTPDEVLAFDQSAIRNPQSAIEEVVDRLLESRHYGEHQARYWLDQARYADSNGYEKDERRSLWPYRDWVIDAFNRDLPFDQFTLEQLAGDLLPNATQEQRIATGFHRNTMVNSEGGADDEEFRVAAVVDRVNTTMDVWMGTTMGCVQCHNHKYDPFTHAEYYQLFAFFNNTEDRGIKVNAVLPVLDASDRPRWDTLEAELAALRKALDTPPPRLAEGQAQWEAQGAGKDTAWKVLDIVEAKSDSGTKLTTQKDGSLLATGPIPEGDTYTLTVKTDLTGITAFRLEVLPDPSLPAKGPGRADGEFVLVEFKVEAAPKGAKRQAIRLHNPSSDISIVHNPVEGALDDNPRTGWGIAPQVGQPHVAVFETAREVGVSGGTVLTFTLDQTQGEQNTIGRLRLSATTAPQPVRAAHSAAMATILCTPRGQRTPDHLQELAAYYRSFAPELNETRERIVALRNAQAALEKVTTLVMRELPQPRPTHVLLRGNHQRPGDRVQPGVPAIWHPFPDTAPRDRLGLARWLIHPDNPLVGRVVMNRLWARYFGQGLVETSEDFGARGELPSHPELLDWLATELQERKWSMKAMHRLIVTSATYRQSSRLAPELRERDPSNRLLARGPRLRLDAEVVRDNALAVSGLLNRRIGGPSVFPHQPDGIWNNPYSLETWQTDTDGNQHRRGLYAYWRRTAPYASFTTFDAPSRETTCDRRPRSNTPLQALTVLNDKAFVECAVALGRRMLSEAKGSDRDRASYGFRLCLSRGPSAAELDHLVALYQDSLKSFRKDTAAAQALLKEGAAKSAKETDAAEWAAWTAVANVLLNLDEMLTKE